MGVNEMAKYKLQVHYDGPSLEDNSIPIKDLAPSLLSLSEAFQTIQELTHPEEEKISLNIKATNKGSFIAELFLVNGPDLLTKAMNLLNSNPSQALLNLTTYVGIFAETVHVIKKIAGKKIKSTNKKNGQVKLTLDDQTSLTMSEEAFKAYKSISFRKEIHDVMQPLNSKGIDKIEFTHSDKKTFFVDKKELSSFKVPDVKEKELDSDVSEVYLQIINVAFEHGKWKFSNGASQFFAEIEDEDFIKSVEKNEQQFGSTDTLKVRLKTTQHLDKDGKLKSDYAVLKVLEHIKGSEQIELDLYSQDDEK